YLLARHKPFSALFKELRGHRGGSFCLYPRQEHSSERGRRAFVGPDQRTTVSPRISMTRAAGFSFVGVSLIGGLIVHHLWGFSSLILFAAGMALSGTISLMWASLSRMGQSEEMS